MVYLHRSCIRAGIFGTDKSVPYNALCGSTHSFAVGRDDLIAPRATNGRPYIVTVVGSKFTPMWGRDLSLPQKFPPI